MSDLAYQFMGVVESVGDDEHLNRVKVRIFGKHEDSTILEPSSAKGMPTEDLPWAFVAMPTTGSGMHGFGQSPHGLVEGSWVWGVSRDGPLYNDLIVLAVILSKAPEENPNPKTPMVAFHGQDGQWPDIEFEFKHDVNRMARGSLEWRDDKNLDPKTWVGWDASVPKKVHSKGHGRSEWDFAPVPTIKNYELVKKVPLPHPTGSEPPTWDELPCPFGAQYPHNKVLFDGPSRTLIEVDETPGAERIAEWHGPSHTYREVHPDGSVQTKIYGSNYFIVIKDNYAWIQGDMNLTVHGNINIYTPDSDIKIHADKGNIDVLAKKGNIDVVAEKGNINVEAKKGKMDVKSKGPMSFESSSKIKMNAPRIEVN